MFCSTIAVFSCNSDEIVSENSTTDVENASFAREGNATPSLIDFQLSNGENVEMLSFQTWQDFQALSESLDTIVEQYDDTFMDQYNHLSNEELELLEEETNYNNQQPLIDFENSIGFTQALRKRFNTEMDLMLETDDLSFALDPNINIAFSGGELSLVNKHQEVMIADTIYVFKNNKVARISSNYIGNLETVRGVNFELTEGGEFYYPNIPETKCYGWRATGEDDNYTSDKKARLVAKVRSIPGWAKAEKMTIHYKKKKNGKWKESKTKMAVTIGAYFFEDCNISIHLFKPRNTYKNKKRRDIKINEWTSLGLIKTKIGGIYGTHHYANKDVYYVLQ